MNVDEKITQILALPDLEAVIQNLDTEIDNLRLQTYRADGEFLRKLEYFVQEKDYEFNKIFQQEFHHEWLRNGYAPRQTCDALMQARVSLIRAKFKTKLAIRRQFPRPDATTMDSSQLRRLAVERDEHPSTYIPRN